MSLIACIFSMGLLTWRIIYGISIEGWTSIILGIVLMGGIQLMGLGILGEYLGRAYMNINKRPQYVIKEMAAYEIQKKSGDTTNSGNINKCSMNDLL